MPSAFLSAATCSGRWPRLMALASVRRGPLWGRPGRCRERDRERLDGERAEALDDGATARGETLERLKQ